MKEIDSTIIKSPQVAAMVSMLINANMIDAMNQPCNDDDHAERLKKAFTDLADMGEHGTGVFLDTLAMGMAIGMDAPDYSERFMQNIKGRESVEDRKSFVETVVTSLPIDTVEGEEPQTPVEINPTPFDDVLRELTGADEEGEEDDDTTAG